MTYLGIVALVAALSVQAAPASPPVLSELEQARLQAIVYEDAAIVADQRTLEVRREWWRAKVAAFKAAAEAARPGWTWDAQTGAWSPISDVAASKGVKK